MYFWDSAAFSSEIYKKYIFLEAIRYALKNFFGSLKDFIDLLDEVLKKIRGVAKEINDFL